MGGVRKHLAQALCFGKVKPVSAMPKIRVPKADGTTAPAQPGVSAAASSSGAWAFGKSMWGAV